MSDSMPRTAGRLRSPGEGPRQAWPTTPGEPRCRSTCCSRTTAAARSLDEIDGDLPAAASAYAEASATLLRLAYNGSDGLPRVIPIGFHWNGNQIVVCTAATAPKVKALSARPNVTLTVDVGDTPTEAKALLVRGLASVDIVDGVPDEYIAASRKVLGADQVTEFERQVRSMYDRMARISIAPVWARFFDFGAGRMPSFLTKLAADGRNVAEGDLGFRPLRAAAIWSARDAHEGCG
jgi:hypothetical protein